MPHPADGHTVVDVKPSRSQGVTMLRLAIILAIFGGCATNTGGRPAVVPPSGAVVRATAAMSPGPQAGPVNQSTATQPTDGDGDGGRRALRIIFAFMGALGNSRRETPAYQPVGVPAYKPPMRTVCRPGITPDTVRCEEVRY